MGYYRAKERNRRLKKLGEETKNSYAVGAYYDERKKRYVRSAPSNTRGYTKSLRKISNKRVRRSDEDFHKKGNSHKKKYDYWWELL